MHDAVYQFTGLGDVVCLAPSERESQWIAQGVGAYLHLRAEPPSTSPKSLRPLSPFFPYMHVWFSKIALKLLQTESPTLLPLSHKIRVTQDL